MYSLIGGQKYPSAPQAYPSVKTTVGMMTANVALSSTVSALTKVLVPHTKNVHAATAPRVGCRRGFGCDALVRRVTARRASRSHTNNSPSGMNHPVPIVSWVSRLTRAGGTPKLDKLAYAPRGGVSPRDIW